jgi:spore coat protein A
MSRLSRRRFLQVSALAGAGLMLPIRWIKGKAYAFYQTPKLRKFVAPLAGLGPTGIPVTSPDTATYPGNDFYKIVAGEYRQVFHPDFQDPASSAYIPGFNGSKLWGYADETFGQTPNHRYLGGVIVAEKGRPVRLMARNNLPNNHPLPVDTTIMGAEPDQNENRIAIHLHGGHTPWISDGTPFQWFDPYGNYGPSSVQVPGMATPAGSHSYYYPNDQSSRLAWYHDHAMGITRLNAYAGLASAYIITDHEEALLIKSGILPGIGIPLIIQDKTFIGPLGNDQPGGRGEPGDLWYPSVYEKASTGGRWDYGPDGDPPASVTGGLPLPSCVPEFFADTPIVNGVAYPYLDLEQRHYRFRILNGSQARFYNLQLYYAKHNDPTEANLAAPGPDIVQIGTEGGFLPAPVLLNKPPAQIAFDPESGNAISYNLLLAPGERADIIINFSTVPSGSKLILYNDAPAPFPGGDPLNDYSSITAGAQQGFGPNTRTLLQFRIGPRTGKADPATLNLLEQVAKLKLAFNPLPFIPPLIKPLNVKQRDLTLNEDFDEFGRLIQLLGTNMSIHQNTQGLTTFGRAYVDDVTENPKAGSTEIWRIFNLTGDTHPIHFHLVNVRVLSRQPFDVEGYHGSPHFTGRARNPDANERGWKETVRMNPGECTTVVIKFDLPKTPFTVPLSQRVPPGSEKPINGHEYVWHCHILEHEEHDMMRPLVVMP